MALIDKLTAIGDAIRGKTGGTDLLTLDGMVTAIEGISGGSGGSVVQAKEVNFYDYDGTLLHAYTVAEAQALTALPDGPAHNGLVFQGWNWSLESVNATTRAMNIGAMYTTDDGTTRLYITLQEGRTSPMLGVGVNGTVTVDWGDGTTPDTLTGTSASTTVWTPNHFYAAPGDYVIRLTVDGEMAFTGSAETQQYACILRYASTSDKRNHAYRNRLQRVEIGSGVKSISNNAFSYCYGLASISIPDSVTSIGNYAFYYCYALTSVTFPDGVTSIGIDTFHYCYTLASVSIPDGVTSIGSNAFANCNVLASFTIPDGVTKIERNAFQYCKSLVSVVIPDGVASIGDYVFSYCDSLVSVVIPDGVTSIGNGVFMSCFSLTIVIIRGSVPSIGTNVFYNCYPMVHYDFTACTAVPTLSSTGAFEGIPADCEIRVPAALYEEWIAATNWSTYADYIKAY